MNGQTELMKTIYPFGLHNVHKNWLTRGLYLPRKSVVRLTDWLNMTLTVMTVPLNTKPTKSMDQWVKLQADLSVYYLHEAQHTFSQGKAHVIG